MKKPSVLNYNTVMKRFFVLMLLVMPFSANAEVAYIRDANVNAGELTARVGAEYNESGSLAILDNYKQFETEFTYGFSESFGMGIELGMHDSNMDDLRYEFSGVSGTYQFFEQDDRSPVAVALRGQYDVSHVAQDKIAADLLFSHAGQMFSYNVNVGVGSEVGTGANDGLNGNIATNVIYMMHDIFSPGIAYYSNTGELDELNDFDDQNNRVGPFFYGALTDNFYYEAGYLYGLTDAAADNSFVVNFQYRIKLND